jgi:hypothetical protein
VGSTVSAPEKWIAAARARLTWKKEKKRKKWQPPGRSRLLPSARLLQRSWGYANRPFPGCGCLWLVLVVVIIWWVIAAFVYPPARFGWW